MAASPPRPSRARKTPELPKAEAQKKFLDLLSQGWQINDACAAVGRKYESYRAWCRDDPEFKAKKDAIKGAVAEASETGRLPVPDFPTFCAELGQPLNPHQLRMWDAIEGREPRDMHPSFRFQRGVEWEPAEGQHVAGRVIVNLPPGHAKTTTFSVNYSTWLIHRNPDIRIIVVCKDQGLARQILGAVKFRLTSPVYREIHQKYGPRHPDGTIGWKDPDASWTQTEIYVQGRGSGEKDPTMQALGIGGRIYGARSDVIFLDDAVTLANVNEYEKQSIWLDQEVESRLDGAGLLALLGTRIRPQDLYSHQRDITDLDDEPVYTYFSMPAVLDEGDGTPETWVTLWPERFPGKRLRKIRRDESQWALVYQQQDVAEDATFNARAVEASVNSARFPGPLSAGAMGHREGGMDGLYVIGGLDPAAAGCTAMIVLGLDRKTGKRYVIDGFNQRGTSVETLKATMRRLTEQYRINEWVVETNAAQKFLIQDASLRQFMQGRGVKMGGHNTNREKLDPDFGVMSMAQLFMTCGEPPSNGSGGAWRKTPEKALIELPAPRQNAWVSELINQLVVWQPHGMKQLQKTDLVMALWFTEIACQRMLNRGLNRPQHAHNPFLSRSRARQQRVINLSEFREAREEVSA